MKEAVFLYDKSCERVSVMKELIDAMKFKCFFMLFGSGSRI